MEVVLDTANVGVLLRLGCGAGDEDANCDAASDGVRTGTAQLSVPTFNEIRHCFPLLRPTSTITMKYRRPVISFSSQEPCLEIRLGFRPVLNCVLLQILIEWRREIDRQM